VQKNNYRVPAPSAGLEHAQGRIRFVVPCTPETRRRCAATAAAPAGILCKPRLTVSAGWLAGGKSGGGPPHSKTLARATTTCANAQRLGVLQPPGASAVGTQGADGHKNGHATLRKNNSGRAVSKIEITKQLSPI
jgi:hypothetical protein